jgi:hypothetical protein
LPDIAGRADFERGSEGRAGRQRIIAAAHAEKREFPRPTRQSFTGFMREFNQSDEHERETVQGNNSAMLWQRKTL